MTPLCSGGSFTPVLGIHIPKQFGIFQWKLHPKPPSPLSPNAAASQKDQQMKTPLPGMLKIIPTEYLNFPQKTDMWFFPHFCLLSGRGRGASGNILFIKHRIFLIWFDLVSFGLLCQQRGLWGCRNFSSWFKNRRRKDHKIAEKLDRPGEWISWMDYQLRNLREKKEKIIIKYEYNFQKLHVMIRAQT